MQPDNRPNHTPSLHVPSRDGAYLQATPRTTTATPSQQGAVADMTRAQLEQIYQGDPNHTMPTNEPAPQSQPEPVSEPQEGPKPVQEPTATVSRDFTPENPYQRTHDDSNLEVDQDAWKHYHSAWQSYYQQYFHRYYAGHIMQTKAELDQANAKVQELEHTPHVLTPEEAMDELRTDLRGKIQARANKVRKSRHFMPIIAAVSVMLIFVLLQYNTILAGYAAAYVNPGAINPSNIIVDPNSSTVVSSDPRVIVPKIAVDAPAIYDNTMGSSDQDTYNKQMAAMEKGLAWFGVPGADSHPGQIGNTVLAGHSSNDWLQSGNYKYVFARLSQLTKGDTIYVNYQGTRYTYVVTDMKVVKPNDVGALVLNSDKPMLTLLTCTPLGTALNRLLVFAEQVTPDPSKAAPAPSSDSGANTGLMPGNSPSALQRLFGG